MRMRAQLAWPYESFGLQSALDPGSYNALVTMHGTIMVFWVAMPILLGAFGNFPHTSDDWRRRYGVPETQHALVLDVFGKHVSPAVFFLHADRADGRWLDPLILPSPQRWDSRG